MQHMNTPRVCVCVLAGLSTQAVLHSFLHHEGLVKAVAMVLEPFTWASEIPLSSKTLLGRGVGSYAYNSTDHAQEQDNQFQLEHANKESK